MRLLLKFEVITILTLLNYFSLIVTSMVSENLKRVISLGKEVNFSMYYKTYEEEMKDPELFNSIPHKNYPRALEKDIVQFHGIAHHKVKLPQYLNEKYQILEYTISDIYRYDQLIDKVEYCNYTRTYDPDLLRNDTDSLKDIEILAKAPYLDVTIEEPRLENKNAFYFQDIDLKNIVAFGNLIFGLNDQNKLDVYRIAEYRFDKSELANYFNDIDELKIENKVLKKIVLDSNEPGAIRRMMIIDIDDRVYLFQLKDDLDLKHFGVTMTILGHFHNSTIAGENVKAFVYDDERIYVGMNEGRIVILHEDGYFRSEIKEFPTKYLGSRVRLLQVVDLQKVEDTIFILTKAYGIKVLDIKNKHTPKWLDYEFQHPFIKGLFIHNNPYFKEFFVGVLIDHAKGTFEGNEFFIELNMKDPRKPVLYRSYLSEKPLNFSNVMYDSHFTYLFEHKSKTMYLMSRSSTATSQNSVFEVQLGALTDLEIENTFQIHNHAGALQKFFFQTGKKLYFMREVELTQPTLSINFYIMGLFKFKLIGFADQCLEGDSTIGTFKTIEKCQYALYYNFNVTGIEEQYYTKFNNKPIYFFILTVLGALVAVSVILYLNKENLLKFFERRSDDNRSIVNNEVSHNSNNLELAHVVRNDF